MTRTDARALFIAFTAILVLGFVQMERQFAREDLINQEQIP